MTYLFRDSDIAARRLRVLADVFAPASEAFVQDCVVPGPSQAVDLGCGPGYTTRLIAATTRCEYIAGIDSSEYFLTLARENAPERMAFVHHDVTRVPFPVHPCDLIYCRMLLTHLQDPYAVIERWATQLNPRGRLLLEEVEWIQTQHPLFSSYLAIVAAMLEQQANQLYIGPLLHCQAPVQGLARYMSRVYHLSVSTKQAATMFSMNIPAWRNLPFIREHYAEQEIEQLEDGLRQLAETSTAQGEIEWGMRQIAYERESSRE